MIRASFLYRASPGNRFDLKYYVDRHVPMARRILEHLGLVRLEIDRGLSAEEPGSAPGYACVAHLYFESAEAFYAAMAAAGDELGADVPNYTDAEMDVQVSEMLVA